MRSTGKFDKNGVEVQEGDTIRVMRRLFYSGGQKIPWADGKEYKDFICEWDDRLSGYRPFCELGYDGEDFLNDSPDNTFEVISKGNNTHPWSTTPPTSPGWYWCRFDKDDREPIVVKVGEDGETAYECGCECGITDLSKYEWCGPITPPE